VNVTRSSPISRGCSPKLTSGINIERFPITEFLSPFLDSRLLFTVSHPPTDVWLLQKIPCIRLLHEKNLFDTSRCDTNKILFKPSITTLSIALVFEHKACFGGKGPSPSSKNKSTERRLSYLYRNIEPLLRRTSQSSEIIPQNTQRYAPLILMVCLYFVECRSG